MQTNTQSMAQAYHFNGWRKKIYCEKLLYINTLYAYRKIPTRTRALIASAFHFVSASENENIHQKYSHMRERQGEKKSWYCFLFICIAVTLDLLADQLAIAYLPLLFFLSLSVCMCVCEQICAIIWPKRSESIANQTENCRKL